MTFHHTGGPAPAYRLAPDTPAEIASDLARLLAQSTAPAAPRHDRFGSLPIVGTAGRLTGEVR